MASKERAALAPVRSAFSAAFLSFLLPGLGQAYLRRWLRAALWMVLPMVSLIAGVAFVATTGVKATAALLLDPDVLTNFLLLILFDALYRLAAVLDAWRLARDPLIGTGRTRTASSLGVLLIVTVLIGSHAAAAMPVRFAQDTLDVFDGGGDTSPVQDISELPAGLRDEILSAAAETTGPNATPDTTDDPATPSPTIEPWDPNKRLDILLVGVDSGRPGETTYLTDTMMVVSIDPKSGRMALISLPRDTVDVPLPKTDEYAKVRRIYGNSYAGRINSLYIAARIDSRNVFPGNDKHRGYKALMGALSELYGLDIGYYVSVDLNSFRGAVNAFGGLVLDVQLPLYDPGYSASDGRGHVKLYLPPGFQYLNGQQALAYARSRKTTSDFDRAARQQFVIDSLRDQIDLDSLLEPGRIGALRAQVEQHMTTNIPQKMLPQLALLATELDTRKPKSLVLSPTNGYGVTRADYDIQPNVSKIRRAVKNVFRKGSKKSTASPAPSPPAVPAASPAASPPAES